MNEQTPPASGDSGGTPLSFHEFSADERTSPLKKYQDLVIGDRNLWHLFRFEFLTFGLTYCPGLIGYFLRQKLYRRLFREMSRGVMIGTGVTLRQTGKISLGRGVVVDDLARLSVRGGADAGIVLHDHSLIGRDTSVNVRDGVVEVGSGSSVGGQSRLAATKGKLTIGEHVLIAAYCYIGGGGHEMGRKDVPMVLQGPAAKGGVTIGDDVWIGTHSVVLDGVSIGKGSVIGAGSLVNKDIPEYSIAWGWPAEVQRKRE